MAEWLKAPVLKTDDVKASQSSNLWFPAKKTKKEHQMVTKEQLITKLDEIAALRDELWRKESIQPVSSEEDEQKDYTLSIWEDVLDWVLKN